MAEPFRSTRSRGGPSEGHRRVAGLVSVPAIIAACSSATSSTAPSAGACAGASAAASGGGGTATGHVTFGSNYSNKDTDTKAMQAVVDAFTKKTGIAVKVNTVDHNTFQGPDQRLPAGHAR